MKSVSICLFVRRKFDFGPEIARAIFWCAQSVGRLIALPNIRRQVSLPTVHNSNYIRGKQAYNSGSQSTVVRRNILSVL